MRLFSCEKRVLCQSVTLHQELHLQLDSEFWGLEAGSDLSLLPFQGPDSPRSSKSTPETWGCEMKAHSSAVTFPSVLGASEPVEGVLRDVVCQEEGLPALCSLSASMAPSSFRSRPTSLRSPPSLAAALCLASWARLLGEVGADGTAGRGSQSRTGSTAEVPPPLCSCPRSQVTAFPFMAVEGSSVSLPLKKGRCSLAPP